MQTYGFMLIVQPRALQEPVILNVGVNMSWIVQTRGDKRREMEISAVDEHSHGAKSWGWPNVSSKIIIKLDTPDKELLKLTQDLCKTICDFMNKRSK